MNVAFETVDHRLVRELPEPFGRAWDMLVRESNPADQIMAAISLSSGLLRWSCACVLAAMVAEGHPDPKGRLLHEVLSHDRPLSDGAWLQLLVELAPAETSEPGLIDDVASWLDRCVRWQEQGESVSVHRVWVQLVEARNKEFHRLDASSQVEPQRARLFVQKLRGIVRCATWMWRWRPVLIAGEVEGTRLVERRWRLRPLTNTTSSSGGFIADTAGAVHRNDVALLAPDGARMVILAPWVTWSNGMHIVHRIARRGLKHGANDAPAWAPWRLADGTEVDGPSWWARRAELRDAHRIDIKGDGLACLPPVYLGEAPVPGTVLHERFEVVRALGAGGMAGVFLARDRAQQGSERAIKVLLPPYDAEPTSRERFRREAQIMRDLRHPHIVEGSLHMARGDHEPDLLEMPRYSGRTLADAINSYGQKPGAVRLWLCQALDALRFVHAHGHVHRDVKPANLLYEHDRVLLTDFGVARYDRRGAAGVTDSSDAVGTMAYLAPEQGLDPQRAGAPADIYSLGVTMHHVWMGSGERTEATLWYEDGPLYSLLVNMRHPNPALRPTAAQALYWIQQHPTQPGRPGMPGEPQQQEGAHIPPGQAAVVGGVAAAAVAATAVARSPQAKRLLGKMADSVSQAVSSAKAGATRKRGGDSGKASQRSAARSRRRSNRGDGTS